MHQFAESRDYTLQGQKPSRYRKPTALPRIVMQSGKAHPPEHIWNLCRRMERCRRAQGQAKWSNYFIPAPLSLLDW